MVLITAPSTSPTEWKPIKLQDICELITDGKHGDCQNEDNSGYYFVSCKDVKDGWVDYSNARQITKSDFLETHRRTQLAAGDIVVTNSGTIGRMALIPNNELTKHTTFQKSVAIIKPKKNAVQSQWLFYYLNAKREDLISWAGGTAQKNLLLRDLRALCLNLPPTSIQQKIAAILSAYDDLIENNTRRIRILEEMTQAIYREWFVNFSFSGHEGVRMVESELGPVPEGWEIKKIKDLCSSVNYGYTTKASDDPNGPKFLRITDIVPSQIDWESVPYCQDTPPDFEKYQLINGDIVVARTGATSGYGKRINKKHPPAVFASYLVRLRIKTDMSNYYIGLIVESDVYKKFIQTNLSGSAQPQANAHVLTSMEIVIPSREILSRFDSVMSEINDLKEELQFENANLRRTRDLLLPKLISGKIDVSGLDIKIPADL